MLEQYKDLTVIISLGLIAALFGSFWWIYEIGVLYRVKKFAEAQWSATLLLVFTVLCGAIEFFTYKDDVPIAWIVISGMALWIKVNHKIKQDKLAGK